MATSSKFDVSNRVFALLVIIIVGVTSFWGFRVYQIWQSSAGEYPRQITVDAEGSAYVVPDVAKLNVGVMTESKDSGDAVTEGANKINAVMKALEDEGIEKKDIKTSNYSLNPKYNWTEKDGNKQDGYRLNQSLEVKVRDLSKVGKVLAAVSGAGGNTVGGVNFEVDNPEAAKNQAREDALKKINAKVAQISKVSDIEFGKVMNYYENTNGGIMYGKGMAMIEEVAMDSRALPAPTVEAGEQEVTLNVSITYKIK